MLTRQEHLKEKAIENELNESIAQKMPRSPNRWGYANAEGAQSSPSDPPAAGLGVLLQGITVRRLSGGTRRKTLNMVREKQAMCEGKAVTVTADRSAETRRPERKMLNVRSCNPERSIQ